MKSNELDGTNAEQHKFYVTIDDRVDSGVYRYDFLLTDSVSTYDIAKAISDKFDIKVPEPIFKKDGGEGFVIAQQNVITDLILENEKLKKEMQTQKDIISANIELEKLQKELQEFKKSTNEFQTHLTGVSITLSVTVVFILILICFF
jgi:hypothetical protein